MQTNGPQPTAPQGYMPQNYPPAPKQGNYPPQQFQAPPQQNFPPQQGFPPKSFAAPPGPGFPPQRQAPPPRPAQYPAQTTGYYPPQQAQPNYPANQYPPQGNPPYDGFAPPNYQQPQQTRKIEPDHLPSVVSFYFFYKKNFKSWFKIQVMQEDEKAHAGVFITNEKGAMPPLMTTNFTVQDAGNCSPRFMRSTLYSVPCTTETMKMVIINNIFFFKLFKFV